MASTFGDHLYSKLPPIRKGRENEEDDFNTTITGFGRETHGLVRLPPIQCGPLDLREKTPIEENLYSTTPPVPNFITTDEGSIDASKFRATGFPFRDQDAEHDEGLTRKTIREIPERGRKDLSGLHYGERLQNESRSDELFRVASGTPNATWRPRKENALKPENKLQRSRRLAKSSPDLSSQRKMIKTPARETQSVFVEQDSVNRASLPLSLTRGSGKKEREMLDIDVNVLGVDQSSRGKRCRSIREKGKGNIKSQTKHGEDERKSVSHPNTPVTPHYFDIERASRKSMGDIGDYALRGRRRLSIAPPKKQNLMPEKSGMGMLRVDGKSCPQNERQSSRSSTPRLGDFLQVPDKSQNVKQPSVYDLQQILSVLNKEASYKSSGLSSGTEKEKERAGSVYDLQEFLQMQQQLQPKIAGKKEQIHRGSEQLSVADSDSYESRRGSYYDLAEFLALNASNNSENRELRSENTDKDRNNNGAFLSPNGRSGSQEETTRRSSVYDLMEFLTLVRQSEETQVENQMEPLAQAPQISLEAPPGDQEDTISAPHNRSNSVYDLSEFLSMTRYPPQPIKGKDLKPTAGNDNFLTPSPKLPNLQFKRESIYDLKEFLGIIQKESEVPRTSGDNRGNNTQNSATNAHVSDETKNDGSCDRQLPVFTFDTQTLGTEPQPHGRAMSVYDLREFIALYATQPPESSPRLPFHRKASAISQSSIMVNVVEDEHGNGNVEDVFVALPTMEGMDLDRKRGSVYDLKEFLGILNTNDAPLRRRLSSVSSNSEASSGRPSPVSRHDSGGAKSLYDLGEFLAMMNDTSEINSKRGEKLEQAPPYSRHDSDGNKSMYNLEEFLPILNEYATTKGKDDDSESTDIRISVPQLPPRAERQGNTSERGTLRKRISAPKTVFLNSVPEGAEVSISKH